MSAEAPSNGQHADLPKFPLVPLHEIRLGSLARYLVHGVIPLGGLILVWGPPKQGKSFWIFDLMMHVALGRDYRGRRVRQGAVIYCAFEGQKGFEQRVEAFRQRVLPKGTDECSVPFYLEKLRLDLVKDHTELIASIRAPLGEVFPAAVVLDTLNRSMHGSESNDADMSAYIAAADAIREAFPDCAVIIIHHSGHGQDRPRGHSALIGAVDAQIAVKKDRADNVIATVEEMKDGESGAIFASRLERVVVGIDEDGEEITSCIVVAVDAVGGSSKAKLSGGANRDRRLLQAIAASPGASQRAWFADAGLNTGSGARALGSLERNKLIERGLGDHFQMTRKGERALKGAP